MTIPEAVEEIDIGGVTLIRAAAKLVMFSIPISPFRKLLMSLETCLESIVPSSRLEIHASCPMKSNVDSKWYRNHQRVCILSDPQDYAGFLQGLDKGEVTGRSRQLYALKAFTITADYDQTIADFFRKKYAGEGLQHISLRYGANPHQKPAAALNKNGPLPFKVLNGSPGYINLLDSLNAWPLVKELKQALGLPAAASFKHVSPAGAAIGVPMTEKDKEVCMVADIEGLDGSGLARAYARARGSVRCLQSL